MVPPVLIISSIIIAFWIPTKFPMMSVTAAFSGFILYFEVTAQRIPIFLQNGIINAAAPASGATPIVSFLPRNSANSSAKRWAAFRASGGFAIKPMYAIIVGCPGDQSVHARLDA